MYYDESRIVSVQEHEKKRTEEIDKVIDLVVGYCLYCCDSKDFIDDYAKIHTPIINQEDSELSEYFYYMGSSVSAEMARIEKYAFCFSCVLRSKLIRTVISLCENNLIDKSKIDGLFVDYYMKESPLYEEMKDNPSNIDREREVFF